MKDRGVIIGGGIGGLLAGYVLAERFERVTILERDHYPRDVGSPAPPTRRGVPQSRCLHLLTAAGAASFDELAEGWSEGVVARGAIAFDASAGSALRVSAGWLPRTPSGIVAFACSRALTEEVLRRGLTEKTNVEILEGQRVLGLLSRPQVEGVAGVRVLDRTGPRDTTHVADLVVDASGAGSALPQWLARLSNGEGSEIESTVVGGRMAYVSRWYHLRPADAPDWSCLSTTRTVDDPHRAAIMLRAEGDRWGVALLATTRAQLPADDAAFLDFTAGLCDGALHRVLARATPVSPIYHHGPSPNRMMRYDRHTSWPEGLVALGDSACAFDPYFGLGMTMAARGAMLLGMHIDRGGTISARAFQKELAHINSAPWQLATGSDPDGGAPNYDVKYIRQLYDAAPGSPKVAHALLAVQHMLRPAESLMEVELG
jgi:2-polyprenyl-6-methoxyphenol hydroxylase-like FAD-dependent oxidoreductase